MTEPAITEPTSFSVDIPVRMSSAGLPPDREVVKTGAELSMTVVLDDYPSGPDQPAEALGRACSQAMRNLAEEARKMDCDMVIGAGLSHSMDRGSGTISVVAYGTSVKTRRRDPVDV